MAWVYILRCRDESFYVGMTRHPELGERLNQHQQGKDPKAYLYSRRPFELVWAEWFDLVVDAMACERRLKGWSRAKKIALIERDFEKLKRLASRARPKPSTDGRTLWTRPS